MTTMTTIQGFERVAGTSWVRSDFYSVGAIIDTATAVGLGNLPANASQSDTYISGMNGRDSFFNGHTIDSIKAGLEDCSRHLIDTIDAMRDRIGDRVAPPVAKRRKRVSGLDEGSDIDVFKWRAGDHETAWSDRRKVRREARVARVAVNVACLSSRRPQDLLYRGAAAAAIADVLTAQGVAVEIVAVSCTGGMLRGGYDQHIVTVRVKGTHEPLNMSAVAFSLCEIGFFRGVIIPARCRMETRAVCSTFGGTINMPIFLRDEFDCVIDSDVLTEADAVQAAEAFIEKVLGDRAEL